MRNPSPPLEVTVEILGRSVPAIETAGGIRATVKGQPIKPESVERYLENKIGADLPEVEQALGDLAQAHTPSDLAAQAYALYEQFRPEIPAGTRGWGARGKLDLGRIRSLAQGPSRRRSK